MKATPGAIYWLYVGAGGGAAEDSGVQSGRGVFWGAGGVSDFHDMCFFVLDLELMPDLCRATPASAKASQMVKMKAAPTASSTLRITPKGTAECVSIFQYDNTLCCG